MSILSSIVICFFSSSNFRFVYIFLHNRNLFSFAHSLTHSCTFQLNSKQYIFFLFSLLIRRKQNLIFMFYKLHHKPYNNNNKNCALSTLTNNISRKKKKRRKENCVVRANVLYKVGKNNNISI